MRSKETATRRSTAATSTIKKIQIEIKDCDAEINPHNRILLQLACTIPVTSCECERCANALRRLNNYMRSHKIINGEEHLANLALLHIHYEQQINVESVIDVCIVSPKTNGNGITDGITFLKNVFNYLTQ